MMAKKHRKQLPRHQRALVSASAALSRIAETPKRVAPRFYGSALADGDDVTLAAIQAWLGVDEAVRGEPALAPLVSAICSSTFFHAINQIDALSEHDVASAFLTAHARVFSASRTQVSEDQELASLLVRCSTPGPLGFPLEAEPGRLAGMIAALGALDALAEDGNACCRTALDDLLGCQEAFSELLAIDAHITLNRIDRRETDEDGLHTPMLLSTFGVACREIHAGT